jgi:DnaJ-domain-containing protein 1
MVNPYGNWWASSEGQYVRNNPRHNARNYGTPFNINDPKIFKTFESKINTLRKSDSLEELKKNYRDLARKYHPDKPNGDHKTFIEIQKEYETQLNKY